ncbi:MAG TPA: hypothetical protein VEZ50_11965, partial [Nodosilinea sp.]|nr:hypothetical protein [Nodosilinea sp.]
MSWLRLAGLCPYDPKRLGFLLKAAAVVGIFLGSAAVGLPLLKAVASAASDLGATQAPAPAVGLASSELVSTAPQPWLWLGLGALGGAAAAKLVSGRSSRPGQYQNCRERSRLEEHLRPLVEAANLTYWEIDLATET